MPVRHLVAAVAFLVCTPMLSAQSAADQIALGDQATVAMDAVQAYAHYRDAIAADSNSYEALWKAAREAVDLGEFEPDKARQKAYFTEGEQFARRAVQLKADDAEGRFTLARALGRVALTLGKKDRVKYGKEVRTQALEALKYDSLHAGALHVLGRWNAEIMRLSGFSRFFAKTFLGGDTFGRASWDSAAYYMAKSVQLEPDRLVHHLDYAEVLYDRNKGDDRQKAREQLELVINGRATDYNDTHYKQEAEEDMKKYQ